MEGEVQTEEVAEGVTEEVLDVVRPHSKRGIPTDISSDIDYNIQWSDEKMKEEYDKKNPYAKFKKYTYDTGDDIWERINDTEKLSQDIEHYLNHFFRYKITDNGPDRMKYYKSLQISKQIIEKDLIIINTVLINYIKDYQPKIIADFFLKGKDEPIKTNIYDDRINNETLDFYRTIKTVMEKNKETKIWKEWTEMKKEVNKAQRNMSNSLDYYRYLDSGHGPIKLHFRGKPEFDALKKAFNEYKELEKEYEKILKKYLKLTDKIDDSLLLINIHWLNFEKELNQAENSLKLLKELDFRIRLMEEEDSNYEGFADKENDYITLDPLEEPIMNEGGKRCTTKRKRMQRGSTTKRKRSTRKRSTRKRSTRKRNNNKRTTRRKRSHNRDRR